MEAACVTEFGLVATNYLLIGHWGITESIIRQRSMHACLFIAGRLKKFLTQKFFIYWILQNRYRLTSEKTKSRYFGTFLSHPIPGGPVFHRATTHAHTSAHRSRAFLRSAKIDPKTCAQNAVFGRDESDRGEFYNHLTSAATFLRVCTQFPGWKCGSNNLLNCTQTTLRQTIVPLDIGSFGGDVGGCVFGSAQ